MQLSKNFTLEELVNPVLLDRVGERCADWLNPNLVPTLQALRDTIGTPITVNDWHRGGIYKNSGLRAPNCNEGALFSTHKGGCAADPKFTIEASKVYYHILNNQDKYPYISRMENIEHTPTWCHIEVSTNKRVGDIVIFNPR